MRRKLRTVIAGAIGCLLALTATSSAATSNREAERAYSMSNGMVTGNSSAYWTIGSDFKRFKAQRGERSVVFSATDAVGTDVRIHLHTDKDGDGDMEDAGDFCSETKPIPVRPGQRIEVAVLLGECPGGNPSVVTEGTITATFSK